MPLEAAPAAGKDFQHGICDLGSRFRGSTLKQVGNIIRRAHTPMGHQSPRFSSIVIV
jgi:hypothetical protein